MENPRPRRPPTPDDPTASGAGHLPPVDVPSSTGKSRKLFVGFFLSALVMSAGGLILMEMGVLPGSSPPGCEPLRADRSMASLFQEAKNRIREGKWTAAKDILLLLQTAEPDYPGLRDYLEQVEKEIPNEARLVAARAALAEQKLAVARAELDQVSAETTMFTQVDELRRDLRAAADLAVREARELFDDRQLDPAKALTDDVLAAFPDHREARRVNDEALLLIQLRDKVAPPSLDPSGHQAKARQLYLHAYALKEAEPKKALAKFKKVLALTPPDDEVHIKAKRWIEQLTK